MKNRKERIEKILKEIEKFKEEYKRKYMEEESGNSEEQIFPTGLDLEVELLIGLLNELGIDFNINDIINNKNK